MFRRILIALNDSRSADEALRRGSEVAEALGAEVRLVHAVFPLLTVDPALTDVSSDVEPLITAAEAMLQSRRRELPAAVQVDTRVVQGRPADAIVDAAHEWNADLIVVGDHRPHSLAAFLLGSTADAVVRRAPCPVMVARPTTWKTAPSLAANASTQTV